MRHLAGFLNNGTGAVKPGVAADAFAGEDDDYDVGGGDDDDDDDCTVEPLYFYDFQLSVRQLTFAC